MIKILSHWDLSIFFIGAIFFESLKYENLLDFLFKKIIRIQETEYQYLKKITSNSILDVNIEKLHDFENFIKCND
jgi:hypothetical protein